MQAKGLVKFFAIALALVCIFQLSFTLKTNRIEKKAAQFAVDKLENFKAAHPELEGQADTLFSLEKKFKQGYLDSISNETVYNLLIKKYTYDQVKDNQLNLGLDLQGGMSVIMQVSIEEMIMSLASTNKKDKLFKDAIALAKQKEKSEQADFVDLFVAAFSELSPNGKMASIFANRQNQGLIEPDYTNEQITQILKEEASDAIDRTYEILNSRIDQFGVSSPYIAKLETSDRIVIELPGVDNPSRVRKLLQAPAKLEFWTTHKTDQIAQFIIDADEALASALSLEEDELPQDTTQPDVSPVELDLPLPGNIDQPEEVVSSDSIPSPVDTTSSFAGFDIEPDTTEENLFGDGVEDTKSRPLRSLLQFGETGELFYGGSVCGYVEPRDTGKVNALLAREEVRSLKPNNLQFLWSAKPNPDQNNVYELYAIQKNPIDDKAQLEGDIITNARQDFDENGNPNITFEMNSEGAAIWQKLTADNVGNQIAIVLDNRVYSAPFVRGEISGGRSEISGTFSITEAKDLANKLKSGKLPAPAKIVQESIVGPTLGKESIRAGVLSMVTGLVLVLLFMVFYYTSSGLVADLALITNIFFIFGVLASLGATLTLPGIAGIVLTIGMAVDANVIIFERVREEILRGKGVRLALIDGYKHSYSAIIDANLTTLITAFILFYFGLGPVLGFATVLIIGIFCSLFTAVMISRLIFDWMAKKDKNISFGSKLTLSAFSKLNINFLGKRRMMYVVSAIVIVAGLASSFSKGFELGVDFKGGRSYHVRFEQPVATQDVRRVLTETFGQQPVVKSVGSSTELKITTAFMIDSSGTNVDSIVEHTLMSGLADFIGKDITQKEFNRDYVLESITVKPTIADDIKRQSVWATIFALLGIFFYILVRFRKWQYSVGALAALAHDVLIVLGIFSIFHGILPFSMEIDQAFIAAILTVIGYSINDTVVVFDRVREYLGERKKDSFSTTVNTAVNTTVSRTVITSLTTLLVIIVLFIFGGEVIRGFSFAIMIGIIIGTYSSIFIATPVMVDLTTRFSKKTDTKPKK